MAYTESCPRPVGDDNGSAYQCCERGHCDCKNRKRALAALFKDGTEDNLHNETDYLMNHW